MSSRNLAKTSDDNIQYVNLAGQLTEYKDDISHKPDGEVKVSVREDNK